MLKAGKFSVDTWNIYGFIFRFCIYEKYSSMSSISLKFSTFNKIPYFCVSELFVMEFGY